MRTTKGLAPTSTQCFTPSSASRTIRVGFLTACCALLLTMCAPAFADGMERIGVSEDKRGFVLERSGKPFVAWGFNYDHDDSGRLIEDYWHTNWPTVVEDFGEMKQLGANVVRIHLQVARFMESPTETNAGALEQLERLVQLAQDTGLYLDITGLGCYHKQDVPAWYDAMSQSERWDVQAAFWEAVASCCADSPAVFCYDLMNEPVLPGKGKARTDWLAGDFAGKYFVQYIALELAGRTRKELAKAWVDKLAGAIRKHDKRHMVTVGLIPWKLTFPKASPLFASDEVAGELDFISVHFYPKTGEVDKAIEALAAYSIGKPVVIEETFPLKCSPEELEQFIDRSRATASGWIGFYWGKRIEEYSASGSIADALTVGWLRLFVKLCPSAEH